jgi:hypothetical protein
MLASTMSATSGAAGGLLGQLGDVLSAPRRFAWDALGLPEDGASFLAQTFGMDKESGLTKALGMGTEMLLDPLTYAGGLLGGPLAKMGAGALNARRAAPLAEEISALTAARRAAQEGLVARSGHEAETLARYAAQADELSALPKLPSIAGGRTHTYNSYTNGLADDMTNAGMAHINPEGQLVTLGEGRPRGVSMNQMQGNAGRKYGSVMDHAGSDMVDPNNTERAMNMYSRMDPLLPDELAHLQATSKANVGNRWSQLDGSAQPYRTDNLLSDFVDTMSSQANASRPMPTLGMHMRDQFLPTGPLKPSFLDTPLPQAFSATQEALAGAMARKKMVEEAALATALTKSDYAKVAGGSYLGSLGLGSGDRRNAL